MSVEQEGIPTDREIDLPISMINQMAYCPRRFWLIFVQGEMRVNSDVLEGELQHRHVHTASTHYEEGQVRYRRLYLWSERLGIRGFADLVEEENGQLIPVEYKHGRQGQWRNDRLQLCAQALCLEERTGRNVPYGYIFYHGSRRRVKVAFDDALRREVEETIAAMRAILDDGRPPPPEQPYEKCRRCSLEPVCLPREVRKLQKK